MSGGKTEGDIFMRFLERILFFYSVKLDFFEILSALSRLRGLFLRFCLIY